MKSLISRARRLMRANKLLTFVFVIVLYSLLVPFYYQRFFITRSAEIAVESSRYSFPQMGIEFTGPAFISVSGGEKNITLKNKLATVEVELFQNKDGEGEPWCRKRRNGDAEKIECLRFLDKKIIVFSTNSRGYYASVENMAASAKILKDK